MDLYRSNPVERDLEPEDLAYKYVRGARAKVIAFTDPLNCPIDIIRQYLIHTQQLSWSCTCKAFRRPELRHGEQCKTTPLYAATAKHLGMAPELTLSHISMTFWHLNWDTWDEDKIKIKEMKWR